ncbi:hypothetical protein J7399_14485 [Shimia sp. R9_1]|uniref:hypothetical protein n=1 Tax=Shimia sp. R9_1 TaxID=2821111 RepID=UPI001ADC14BB|nr:hypothetical protein [Shimia sp. R9_1]MBO9408642.1 hypothetical protein [Shimia sp. R9_1]
MSKLTFFIVLPLLFGLVACNQPEGRTNVIGNLFSGCNLPSATKDRDKFVDRMLATRAAISATASGQEIVAQSAIDQLAAQRTKLAERAQKTLSCATGGKFANDKESQISMLALAAEMSRYAGRQGDGQVARTARDQGKALCGDNPTSSIRPLDCSNLAMTPDFAILQSADDIIFDIDIVAGNRRVNEVDAITSRETTLLANAIRNLSDTSGRIDTQRASGRLESRASGEAFKFQVDTWCGSVLGQKLLSNTVSDGPKETAIQTRRLVLTGERPSAEVRAVLTNAGLAEDGLSKRYRVHSASILKELGLPNVGATTVDNHEKVCQQRGGS